MTQPNFKSWLAELANGKRLDEREAEAAFDMMMSGDATPSQMGAFLMALRLRGETIEEITGAARSMRARVLPIDAPAGAIDTCGTGGDGSGTFNISTAASFVIAACGVPVAKHGNRALSSKSGAADVLTALGVNIDAPMPLVRRAIWENNVGFLMAPRHHGAMRHVGPTRVELGTRTIFNLLGPLTNPAGVTRQVMGVFAAQWVTPIAEVLHRLGSECCWVVHGDGLDELTTAGTSHVASLHGGKVESFTLTAADAGLPQARREDLLGGTPEENAEVMRALLDGAKGPIRDIVLLNSAAALVVGGKVGDLKAGVALAGEALDDRAARRVLDRLIEITNSTETA
ncbi:MAG TPA: anthranilate phosphoribosyltransferase [Aliidongia sp.]|uniref:anthranilate phosphoribosyltransferase n=1 Tax=Aliidongia sp. TaxID=1914230 RepID=UPI002DDDA44A|nr:anthranilate phosphoribosyltransferase [Aliidongia sp.]HEV2678514.1 anthranilate phosphoribosyltransferase [Aliidongia sp.]